MNWTGLHPCRPGDREKLVRRETPDTRHGLTGEPPGPTPTPPLVSSADAFPAPYIRLSSVRKTKTRRARGFRWPFSGPRLTS